MTGSSDHSRWIRGLFVMAPAGRATSRAEGPAGRRRAAHRRRHRRSRGRFGRAPGQPRFDEMSRTTWRRVVASAVVGALLAACGSGGSGPKSNTPSTRPFHARFTRFGQFTVLDASSLAPGAPVMEGIKVPAGSDLLGGTFPDVDGKGGFLALGLVTGDPVGVFNDYLEQA